MAFSFTARAQSLGHEGALSIAAERLSGLSTGTLSIDPEGPIDEFDTDYFSLRLITAQNFATDASPAALPVFSTPRLALDYFVKEQLSVGGTFGVATTSVETEGGAELTSTSLVFNARIGYWLPLSDAVNFWPRGGLSILYASVSDDDDDGTSATLPAISVEAPLMIALGPAFLQIAATLDISFAGSGETEGAAGSADFDVSAYELGIQAGIGLAF